MEFEQYIKYLKTLTEDKRIEALRVLVEMKVIGKRDSNKILKGCKNG